MENFFYNDNFYSDLSELAQRFEDDDELKDFSDDEIFEIELSSEEPIIVLSAEWIANRVEDERLGDDGDDGDQIEKLIDVLNKHVDFEKVNSLIPKMFYTTGEIAFVTIKELRQSI